MGLEERKGLIFGDRNPRAGADQYRSLMQTCKELPGLGGCTQALGNEAAVGWGPRRNVPQQPWDPLGESGADVKASGTLLSVNPSCPSVFLTRQLAGGLISILAGRNFPRLRGTAKSRCCLPHLKEPLNAVCALLHPEVNWDVRDMLVTAEGLWMELGSGGKRQMRRCCVLGDKDLQAI